MADSVLTITATLAGVDPSGLANEVTNSAFGSREVLRRAVDRVQRVASGTARGKFTVRLDSSAPVQASGTCVADVSDCTAGDTLDVYHPLFGIVTITVVDGSADPTMPSVDLNDASDTAFGASIAACFNQHAVLKRYFSATASSGTVTVTCKGDVLPGTIGNTVTFTETADSNSPFAPTSPSGGANGGDLATQTITCGTPDIVADDTITIGSQTLTWKASAATEDQVTLSTTPATAATNLGAAINAHSKLQGLISASVASAVVTVTYDGDPRAGQLIALSRTETNSGSVVLGAAALASAATEAYGDDPYQADLGVL